MRQRFLFWLLVHRRFPYKGSIYDSRGFTEMYIKAAISMGYVSLAIGMLLLSIGVLVETGMIIPKTPGHRPIFGALHVVPFGSLIIQSLHIVAEIKQEDRGL